MQAITWFKQENATGRYTRDRGWAQARYWFSVPAVGGQGNLFEITGLQRHVPQSPETKSPLRNL
jgi:hypothetical protein